MANETANIYKQARLFSQLSRFEASFELNISPSSLKDYETDVRDCPDEIALTMSRLYRAPWLRVQHLMKNVVFCDIFGIVPPASDNALNILRAQKEVGEVVQLFPKMVAKAVQKKRLGDELIKECREGAQALLVLIGMECEKPREQAEAFSGIVKMGSKRTTL